MPYKDKKTQREYEIKWFLENRGKMLVYWRERRKKKMVLDRLRIKKWIKNNKEKVSAHSKVRYAVKKGTLIRGICWCGDKKVEGHHPDYSKPLEVVWLCKVHHNQADRERRLSQR